jgi:hypothetical protein
MYLAFSKIAGPSALHEVMWTGFDEAAMQHGNCFLVRLAGGHPGQRGENFQSGYKRIARDSPRWIKAPTGTAGHTWGQGESRPDDHLLPPDMLELMVVPDRASGTLAIEQEYGTVTLAAKVRMIRRGKWKLVYQPLESGYM